jgi:endoglucanase
VGTGGYGDRNCGDERLWASAELHRATGDDPYHRYFLEHYAEYLKSIRPVGPQTWGCVENLALWTYVLGSGKNAEAAGAIRQASIGAAGQIVERTASNGYRISMTSRDYIWGSNSVAANYGMQLLGANAFRHPHHRPSGADNNPEPWPGLLSGGPNRMPRDPAMRKLPAGLPPAKMYLDDQEAYAANEVAINWNAPLVFLLAAALPDK